MTATWTLLIAHQFWRLEKVRQLNASNFPESMHTKQGRRTQEVLTSSTTRVTGAINQIEDATQILRVF